MAIYPNNGSFVEAQEIFVKDNGNWKEVKGVWIKDGGSWKKVFPTAGGSVTYTTGSGTFIVPAGIYSITVSYPTTSGTTTTTRNVTPGQSIAYSIGGFGSPSTFGSITAPAWDKQVATFQGNVDQDPGLYSQWGVVTPGGSTYSGSGSSGTLYDGAAAAGCYYREFGEGGHGDLDATISITTALSSTIVGDVEVYMSAFSGRGSYVITEQPSGSNSYRAIIALKDPGYSEGSFDYTMNLRQSVPITVSW